MKEKIRSAFIERLGAEPEFLVRAPGRVNLIGEHTDYNDGFVMPLAIEQATWLALRRRQDGRVCLHSIDFEDTLELDLRDIGERGSGASWTEYVRGVAWAMSTRYPQLDGWEGVAGSDIPIGAGLSSSASFELALAGAYSAASGLDWDSRRMAVICHKAEVEWVGVNCGMMDHFASAEGQKGHALRIDCRSLEVRPIPLPANTRVVALDTGKARVLADSAYNKRRAECEEASRLLGVNSLRDASLQMLEEARSRIDPVIFKRARHVISENDRTRQAAEAMEAHDAVLLGQLMGRSHESLRTDYQVSCAELDAMVACAQMAPGCFGARMTGAGFGGCAVALVDEKAVDKFLAEVRVRYLAASGIEPRLYVTAAMDGVGLVPDGSVSPRA